MPAAIYDVFRGNVRQRMEELGINQAELARRLGVTPGYVSQLLNGHGNPGLTTVEEFAHELGVEPAALINRKILSKTA